MRVRVPPERVMRGTDTSGVKVAVPPETVRLPVWTKFAVGMAKLALPAEVERLPALLKKDAAPKVMVAPLVR